MDSANASIVLKPRAQVISAFLTGNNKLKWITSLERIQAISTFFQSACDVFLLTGCKISQSTFFPKKLLKLQSQK